MPQHLQTTIHGALEPLRAPDAPAPRHEQQPLFAAPQTIRGQLAIPDAHSEDQAAR